MLEFSLYIFFHICKNVRMKIIERLKLYVQVSGLSVQECSEAMGVSFATIYRLLNGTSDKSAVLKIDAFLDRQNFYPQAKDSARQTQEDRVK